MMENQVVQSTRLVLDRSVVLAWCVESEGSLQAEVVLRKLSEGGAVVPGPWALEIGETLRGWLDKEILSEARCAHFLELLQQLPIRVTSETPQRLTGEILSLARRLGISVERACYLDLAMREGVPLATLDMELAKAAKGCHVPLLLEE